MDAALGGVAWGGHGLASFAMPLAVAPRRDRTFYLAAFSIAAGAAYGLAAALAGALVTALPRHVAALAPGGTALGLVFVVSAGGRLASAFLALNIDERDAGTLGELNGELNRMARGAARAALALLPRPYGDV